MAASSGAAADPALYERVVTELERVVANNENFRMDFDDSTDDYERAAEIVKRWIVLHELETSYEFWYDGCNYADLDMIRGRPIRPTNGRPHGSCWMGKPWTFSPEFIAEVFEQERIRVEAKGNETPTLMQPERNTETEGCLVCFDAPAETLVMPCGHSVACKKCSDALSHTINQHNCIYCRARIETIITDE